MGFPLVKVDDIFLSWAFLTLNPFFRTSDIAEFATGKAVTHAKEPERSSGLLKLAALLTDLQKPWIQLDMDSGDKEVFGTEQTHASENEDFSHIEKDITYANNEDF